MKLKPGKLYKVFQEFRVMLPDPYIQRGGIIDCSKNKMIKPGNILMFIESKKDLYERSPGYCSDLSIFLEETGQRVCAFSGKVDDDLEKYLKKISYKNQK